MKYDFTTIMDRYGKDAIAVESLGNPGVPGAPKDGFDAIPMWVADMNFPTAPSIPAAITQRVQHPAYGYFAPRQEYLEGIITWHKNRNGVEDMTPEHIGYANSVLGGVISAANILCSRGDNILIHSPTYVGFTGALGNNGYNIVHSPLVIDEQGVWRMDFQDMEKKIREKNIHCAVFCSPHNPCGRVWERWELEKAMEIFEKYGVYVISDEIWSDLILEGYQHIPTQSVNSYAKSHTIAVYAPSKTFNLAGLVGSYTVVYDKWLRDRMRKEESLSHYNQMNVLSMYGCIGAYQPEGYAWLEELRSVLTENVDFACNYIATHFDGVRVCKPQGTYMLFVDCTKWCEIHGKTLDEVLRACWDVGVAVQDGRAFHGACHIRMNLALPLSRVEEAFRRMDKYVFNP